MTDIDHTVIVNGGLPKSWKCPHCGKRQTFTKQDDETFIRYMKFIRHCEKCGYLHFWKLNLTDDFKRKVVDMVAKWAERGKIMTENDIDRMMQCVTCDRNPETCGCTEADEDANGMCMKWAEREEE